MVHPPGVRAGPFGRCCSRAPSRGGRADAQTREHRLSVAYPVRGQSQIAMFPGARSGRGELGRGRLVRQAALTGRSSQVERTAARSHSRADPARSNSWSHSRAGPARSMVALTGRSSPVHPDRAGGVREAGRDQTDTPSGEGETKREQQASGRHGTGRAVTAWPMQAGQRVRSGKRDASDPDLPARYSHREGLAHR